MSQYWFKPKKYGLGMQPCSWQGWVAILVLIGVAVLLAYLTGLITTPDDEITNNQIIKFYISFFVVIVLFIVRIKEKIKGGLRWRWKKDENDDEKKLKVD